MTPESLNTATTGLGLRNPGTLNFSRLNDVRAKFFISKVSPIDLRLGALINMTMFATSYNIFKIEKGLGGILYEN